MKQTTTITLPLSRTALAALVREAIQIDEPSRELARLVSVALKDDEQRFREKYRDAKLTPAQLGVLYVIHRGIERDGFSPTMAEVAEARKVSKVTIFEQVGELERKGVLTRDPHKARSIRLATTLEMAVA